MGGERDYAWDAFKNAGNLAKHGIAFEAVFDFDWGWALIREDNRFDYGEQRFQAIGPIGDRLYVLLYTMRGPVTRVISLYAADQAQQRTWRDEFQK